MFLNQFLPITTLAVVVSFVAVFASFYKKASYGFNYFVAIVLAFLIIIFAYYYHYSILPALALLLPLIAFNKKTNDNINFATTEHSFLLCFMLIGTYQIFCATNFIAFYVGLELQSIPIYIIISLANTKQSRISETIKYFVLSASFSSLSLLGIAYIYGAFGVFDFAEISQILPYSNKNTVILAVFGSILVLIGSFFKLAIAPFHLWISDVYSSLNYRTIAILSVMPKISFVILIINILAIFSISNYHQLIESIIFGAAICSIFIGSISLLAQDNIKRFIAYSGIAQIGFVLMVVASGGNILFFGHIINVKSIALFYLFGYLVSLLPLVVILNNIDKKNITESLSGLIKNNKIVCYCLSLSLISFAGIPFCIGFVAKIMIFANLISMSNTWLAVVVIVPITISVYAYLNLIKIIYFGNNNDNIVILNISEKAVVYGCSFCNIFAIFFVPQIINILNI